VEARLSGGDGEDILVHGEGKGDLRRGEPKGSRLGRGGAAGAAQDPSLSGEGQGEGGPTVHALAPKGLHVLQKSGEIELFSFGAQVEGRVVALGAEDSLGGEGSAVHRRPGGGDRHVPGGGCAALCGEGGGDCGVRQGEGRHRQRRRGEFRRPGEMFRRSRDGEGPPRLACE